MLSLIRENPRISVRELSDKVGISTRKTEENIYKLKKKGFLKRVGPARGGHWEVVEE
ncbi:MAG: winged helix-turn-helix domain-containing protein [Methanosarcina sp.]|uniref:winged helix-turn-helix domain-containing protein n=1 Tax=Methanosarcina sp. TaxID=2213 RepID=UPI00262B7A9B|nr:winged helix-turn-helix domain-containing protein [Methanosarcina sp.]MDD3248087.1 winged helix-turn-helix domain-containing protein [Methanosarcina sp.]MDD4248909.1 winged helix-turn-helix domain-containing protein [Methanosarcina sp.]